jgi:hypothetical protein
MAYISLGNRLRALLLLLLTASLMSCAGTVKQGAQAGTYDGPMAAMGAGSARTFVTIDGTGKPSAIGVKMSDGALDGLQAERPHDVPGWEYVLQLPKEAAGSGYTHVVVNWNPQGHIPPGVYDLPHFDFHFYLMSPEQRAKITAAGEDRIRAHKMPSPDEMPAGYQLPEGTEEARMGAHAIDPTAPEFTQHSFTKTFIYGFYDGRMAFLEPMVTKAFLETKPNVTEAIKLPKKYAERAYYPTKYNVSYDSSRHEYVITLEGLKFR